MEHRTHGIACMKLCGIHFLKKIRILHNLIFLLRHFIVNNLQLPLSVVKVGPVAGFPETVVSVTSGFWGALWTWFIWPHRIDIYTALEWDAGRVLPFLLP